MWHVWSAFCEVTYGQLNLLQSMVQQALPFQFGKDFSEQA
jgi:hypothetical protein